MFAAAALAEIAGCVAFWAWWRLDKSPLWLVPGVVADPFAWLLALVRSGCGRPRLRGLWRHLHRCVACMAVGDEGVRPDRFDLPGAAVCLAGASVILFAPRGA